MRARLGVVEPKPREQRDKRTRWVERVDELLASAHRYSKDSLPGLISEFARQARVLAIADELDGQTAYYETEARLHAAVAAEVTTWAEAERLELAAGKPA
jgi:hypothetical protein